MCPKRVRACQVQQGRYSSSKVTPLPLSWPQSFTESRSFQYASKKQNENIQNYLIKICTNLVIFFLTSLILYDFNYQSILIFTYDHTHYPFS